MRARDADLVFGARELAPVGVGGFMRFHRVLPGVGALEGVGDIPNFPPATPSAYQQDADDLNARIKNADQLVLLASAHVPPPSFPFAQWADFNSRWQQYYANLSASWWTRFNTDPFEENAYWDEYRGFLPALGTIGYKDASPREPASGPTDWVKSIAPIAIAVALIIAMPQLALVAKGAIR